MKLTDLELKVNNIKQIITNYPNSWMGSNFAELFKIDHICYRCSSSDEYEEIRKDFEFNSKFIYQAIISNRRISIIKLNQPIKTMFGHLHYLELCDQKTDNSQVSEFDHIELVPKFENYNELIQTLKNNDFDITLNKKAHHTTYDLELEGIIIKFSTIQLVDKVYQDEMK